MEPLFRCPLLPSLKWPNVFSNSETKQQKMNLLLEIRLQSTGLMSVITAPFKSFSTMSSTLYSDWWGKSSQRTLLLSKVGRASLFFAPTTYLLHTRHCASNMTVLYDSVLPFLWVVGVISPHLPSFIEKKLWHKDLVHHCLAVVELDSQSSHFMTSIK